LPDPLSSLFPIAVTYASMFGSTGEIAEAIGQALCRKGAQADVQYLNNTSGLTGYDAVIVGSAIRSNKWQDVLPHEDDHEGKDESKKHRRKGLQELG
jgi:flavorubredoxin